MVLLVVSWFTIEWTDAGASDFPGGIVLRDTAGEVLRVSLGEGDVDCRPFYSAEREDWIVKALVASEDGTFWTHSGVRPLSMLRAAAQNFFFGRRISGASTISMQTVRLIAPHRKTYLEKWKEAVRAVKMERAKDKLWILSQYLNRAPFGSNFIGIEAAANGWFGTSAKNLGLGEAALLAGMVQAPSRFRPDRGYERALKRRDYVLERMLKLGFITSDQLEGARKVSPVVSRAPRPFKSPHYCDYYLSEVLGTRGGANRGGDIRTPLDPDVQALVEQTVRGAAQSAGYEIAALVMKAQTGEVVALACSGDYFDADSGQVNTALAPRPAGSTLKPFLAAQALDLGLTRPDERLDDRPRVYSGYSPANFDGTYRGEVSLRESLILSLNLPFVELVERVGVERFGTKLRELGLRHVKSPFDQYGLGIAIGNCEVTLVELASAYHRLAAAISSPERRHALSPVSAYLVSDMLSGGERAGAALGHIADVALPRFAWKTGTSSAYRDAWTILWNPDYVVGVWCGHKYGGFGDTSLVGAKAAAPLAWRLARALYPQGVGPWFAPPEGAADALAVERRRRDEPKPKAKLEIAKPCNGAEFVLVPGVPQQRIVCRVVGNEEGRTLWWFVDGSPVGETTGAQPKTLALGVGAHTVVCSTREGESAEVSFTLVE